jgi:hypothetical protein
VYINKIYGCVIIMFSMCSCTYNMDGVLTCYDANIVCEVNISNTKAISATMYVLLGWSDSTSYIK